LRIRFAWMTPELRRANIQAAVAAAKAVKTPVVFVWNEVGNALSLPEDQDELIRRVAAANPRTIVVLTTGGPVAMPWKDSVRAILEMWYPGQEGGWATANLLLGRANPGGKLPVTFPVRIEDAPARAIGHPERWAPLPPPGGSGIGTNAPTVTFSESITAAYRLILDMLDRMTPVATFSEGIAVGYRWYDQQNIQPLFPFGHGLSYTRFRYSELAVKLGGDGVDVIFTLRNTGSRKGAEVPQVYLGPASNPPVPMVPKSLVGFQRVELEPGRSKRVRMHIDGRGLSYWSIDRHDWVTPPGRRPIYVGASSRDIRIEGLLPSTTRGSP
jgi:beta-glucosidase